MKKLILVTGALVLSIFLIVLSPLKDRFLTFWILESIAHLDNVMTPLDSPVLGQADRVEGKEPMLALDKLTDLGDPKLDIWIEKSQTQALIIKRKGEILHESYSPQSDKGLNINALSMTKTVVAILIGIAIDEKLIQSEEDSVQVYLPEIKLLEGDEVSIRDLLQQVSGMRDDLPHVLATLGGESLDARLDEIVFGEDKEFAYSNVNYHLLGLILSRVYQKALSDLIAEKLWLPLALESGRVINSTGYCCLFATAQSWLKIGELLLNKGAMGGRQLVSASWVDKMINEKTEPEFFMVQSTNKSVGNFYGFHIFSGLDRYPELYWSEGMGMQIIMIDESTETIIVRLGDVPSAFKVGTNRWDRTFVSGLLEVVDELPANDL